MQRLIALALLVPLLGTLLATNIHAAATTQQVRLDARVSFEPEPIPEDAEEIVNPMRGLYRWLDQELAPTPRPAFDSYDRVEWNDLELQKDQYDFSIIEKFADEAASKGGTFSFRVRTVVSTKGKSVPDYLADAMKRGWWRDYDDDGKKDTYVPDWNDPYFMERAEKLLTALGEQYNNDPRIGWIDIGLYGNWGEWHMYNFPYPSPSGAQSITKENKQRIVNMHIAAFPNKQLLMMSDDEDTLVYALEQSPTIGWRRDSLGTDHFDSIKKKLSDEQWALVSERWKTAPVITEFFNKRRHTQPDTYTLAQDQIKRYHISAVGNGNTFQWSSLTATSQEELINVGKVTGYRFVLRSLTLPSVIAAGDQVAIESIWSNTGVAPAYEPWNVMLELRSTSTGKVVWTGKSGLDLRQLLPTIDGKGNDTPVVQNDTFRLPWAVPAGEYSLAMRVTDPEDHRDPLALAIKGGDDETRSYTLGTVQVAEAGVTTVHLPLLIGQ